MSTVDGTDLEVRSHNCVVANGSCLICDPSHVDILAKASEFLFNDEALTNIEIAQDFISSDIPDVEIKSESSDTSIEVVPDSQVKGEQSETITEVIYVDPGSGNFDKNTVILKLQDPGRRNIFITGKISQLADGTSAFVQNSRNDDDNVVYSTIKQANGTVFYLLASTLRDFLGDATPVVRRKKERLPEEDSEGMIGKRKAYACSYVNCNKKYSSQHHLKVHTRVHTGIRPFKCPHCCKGFSTAFGLKTHLRTHNGERPYQCKFEDCDKSFKTSGDLQKHTRTHTGERPFVCPIPYCGRSFTTCNICKVHVRTHTGEKPYKCTYANCDKTFASVTNQRNHLRIHSGEKPYACGVKGCFRRFTEYSSLYKHNQIHGTLPYTCEICSKVYKSSAALENHIKQSHSFLQIFEDPGDSIDISQIFSIEDLNDEDSIILFKDIALSEFEDDG